MTKMEMHGPGVDHGQHHNISQSGSVDKMLSLNDQSLTTRPLRPVPEVTQLPSLLHACVQRCILKLKQRYIGEILHNVQSCGRVLHLLQNMLLARALLQTPKRTHKVTSDCKGALRLLDVFHLTFAGGTPTFDFLPGDTIKK